MKGDQNGHWCPGASREYGALALQVEWWATDQRPVMVKKLSVNPNCGLGTVRLSGINLGSGKGNKMREKDSTLECGTVYEQILLTYLLHGAESFLSS